MVTRLQRDTKQPDRDMKRNRKKKENMTAKRR